MGVSLLHPHAGRGPEESRSQSGSRVCGRKPSLALCKKAFEFSLLRGSHKLS